MNDNTKDDSVISFAKRGGPPEHPLDHPKPDNVVYFDGVTSRDYDPKDILKAAYDSDLETVIVIGMRKDGSEYFSASVASGPDNLWDIERAKHKLMQMVDDRSGAAPTGGESA